MITPPVTTRQPRAAFLIALLFFVLLLPATVRADHEQMQNKVKNSPLVGEKSVLILNSYHRGFKWSDDIVTAIEETFAPYTDQVTLHHEYMDTKRLFSPEYRQLLISYLSTKFNSLHYDLVIASDNNAFDFIRSHKQTLFPEVPVVFCGLNYLKHEDLEEYPLFTGVREDADLAANFELIRSLHPNLGRLIMITDRTTTGLLMRAEAERLKQNRFSDLDLIIWDNLSIRELLESLKGLSSDDVVLLTLFFRDARGRFFEFDEVARLISAASPVPVYGTWDFSLDHGIVGGMMTTGKAQGNTAARLALRLLSGEPVRDIPVVTTPPAIPMFDYPVLQHFQISMDALPPRSVIINEPHSFYKEHKGRILTLAALILMMLGVIIALLVTISRGKVVRAELEKSEAGLRQIIDTIPLALSARDADGRFLLANATVAGRLGATVQELTGRLIKDVHPISEQARRILETDREVLAQGETLFIPEEQRTLSDGTQIWTQTTKLPYVAARTGEHAVLCLSMDITDRKLAEERLQQSQRFIQGLIDSQPSILVGVDPDCHVLYWNRQAEKLTGISAEDSLGMSLFEALPRLAVSKNEISKAVANRRFYQSSKQPYHREKTLNYEDVIVSPLYGGNQGGAVIRIDDVTERVRIEEIMIQTEKMMTVGGMAAGMAHELNNPLGAILQGIQNVERRISPGLPANQKAAEDNDISLDGLTGYIRTRRIDQMLEGIREAGVRASTIIRNMLDFSRKSESQLAPMDINRLIDTVLNLASSDYDLKKVYDFKKIEIIKDYANDLPPVPITVTEIEQVLLNLLKNAAHAISDWLDMPHPPAIILRTTEERDHVRIEVQDNGPGLAPEIRKRVFEPFFTTKAPGVGTGLGLSVSYFIVTQNHHGTFTVRSRPGQGATFVIRLPKLRPEAMPSEA